MSRIKKHIDEVFREGLKNLSLLVSNKDFEAIDDKASVYKDKEPELDKGLLGNFEIKVDESDWLKTKSKLEVEKSAMSQDNFMSKGFEGFELAVTDADWKATYRKLQDRKRRRVAYWWWLSAGVAVLSIGAFLCLHDWNKKAGIAQTNIIVTPEHTETTRSTNDKGDMQSQDPAAGHAQANTSSGDPAMSNISPVTAPQASANTTTAQSQSRVKRVGANNHAPGTDARAASGENNPASILSENTAVVKAEAPAENPGSAVKGDNPVEVAATGVPSGNNETEAEPVKLDKDADVPETAEATTGKKSGEPDSAKKDEDKKKPVDPRSFALELNRFHFYAGMVNQLGLTYRHLDKSNNAMYNKVRNDAEHPFMQWTTGVEIGVQRNNLRFGTGVQVTTQSWTSDYNYSYQIHDSIPVWDSSHTYVKGYLLTRHRDTAMHEEHLVKIQKVQVPFEFSGLWSLGPRLQMVAGCGGLIGFTTRQTGTKIINPANNQLYYYTRLQDQENDFALSVTGNAGLQYALRPKFLVMGSLYGNYSTTSRFKSSFQAKDFPYSLGISLKLLYLIR